MLIELLGALCMFQSGGSVDALTPAPGQAKTGELKIVRAIYGVPGDSRDITDRIAPAVRGSTLWMRVGAAETGPDPVPGAVKTLTITYTYKGKPGTAAAQDTQSLAIGDLPGPSGQSGAIHIIRAEYGPLDAPAEIRDVADRLVAAVKGDALRLVVGSGALGGKAGTAALNWVRVLYTHRGLIKTTTVPEGWILAIGDVPASRTPDSVLQVVKAEVTAPGYVDMSRDVTALVSLAVAGGALRFVARPDVLGDDATPGIPKSLVVQYVYRGRAGTATVAENEVLELGEMPPVPPKPAERQVEVPETGLRILRAEYGTLGRTGRPLDVTDMLAAKVVDNGLQLHVATSEFGPDPAPNLPKSLRVTYVFRGRVEIVTVPENKDLGIGWMPMPKAQRSDTLKAMPGGPLRIMSADYGDLDRAGYWVDLTDKVASLVTGGALHMGLVELSSEPAPNVLKNLRILYVYKGRIGIAIKNDLERVDIGDGGAP